MSLREKLEDNRTYVVIGAAALIALSILILVVQLFFGGPERASLEGTQTLVYFDLTKQEIRLVERNTAKDGEIRSPLQGTEDVYLTLVYACEQCPPGSVKDGMRLDELQAEGMFITWLKQIDHDQPADPWGNKPSSYRTLEDPTWRKAETEESLEILESHLDRCADAKVCQP